MDNSNQSALTVAKIQSSALRAARIVLDESGAYEVRTPVLNPAHDLAPVHQFLAKNPTNDDTYCLRIAPEEALTRLVALGVPAVYEISNNFRTEEREDQTHLFEFDSVEALYTTQHLDETCAAMERVCREVAQAVSNSIAAPEHPLAAQATYPRINLCEWVEGELGEQSESLLDNVGLSRISATLGNPLPRGSSLTDAVDHVVETVAARFDGAVFIGCFPHFVGGPAARHPNYPDFVERFELFWNGIELGSVANQQPDLRDWRDRYVSNMALRRQLGIELNSVNEKLLDDLAGLPKSYTGFGIGLDRVSMIAA
ncbi:MAG: hypothetical protein COC12_09910, partial [Rhodobacteraceae bacterium]